MLPDGPNTSETQMSLPSLPLGQNRLLSLSAVATNEPTDTNQTLIEQIYPGIYFSQSNDFWSCDRLRSHGFTHIINIDRHITQRLQISDSKDNYRNANFTSTSTTNSTSTLTTARITMTQQTTNPISSNSKTEEKADRYESFNTLDLNFGEESFLTTVLPNCYKAVKFIDKALQNGGAILVMDQCSNQKCLTIVIGFLMYKNNINFNDAFQRVKSVFKKAELEPFLISQLYEYEPILQVERAQLRGHSCSRELRSAQLKRKKMHDDNFYSQNEFNCNYQPFIFTTNNSQHHYQHSDSSSDVAME